MIKPLMVAMMCAAGLSDAQAKVEPASKLAAAAPAATPVAPALAKPPIRKLDGHLVDMKGRGIYVWDGDRAVGRSECNSQCRLLWPPIVAEPGAVASHGFTIAVRDDGTRQWALGDRPLYRWVSDVRYGDAGGDGIGDKWHLVNAGPAAPAKPGAH